MRLEELPSQRTHGDEASSTFLPATLEKASFIRILPHGKTGTRGAPSIDDFCIRPASGTDPFEKIEDQAVDRAGHLARSVLKRGRCRNGCRMPGQPRCDATP